MASNYTVMDPCTEFNAMVCTGWEATHDYRPEQSTIGTLSDMDDKLQEVLHTILESPYTSNSIPPGTDPAVDKANFDKMQSAYHACSDEETIRSFGIKPLTDILDSFEEVFPLDGPETVGKDELTKAILNLSGKGVGALVGAGPSADDKEPDVMAVYLSPGSVGLPSKEYYNISDVVEKYKTAITAMFETMYGNSTGPAAPSGYRNRQAAGFADLAKKISDFEGSLDVLTADPADAADVTKYYNPMTLAEVDAWIPSICITDIVRGQVPKNFTSDRVINTDPAYYKNASAIIASTPREVLHGYFIWGIIRRWSGRLHKDFNKPWRQFNNVLAGRDPDAIADRWRTCVAEVDGNLGWLESGVYVQREFGPDQKAFGDRIIADIRSQFNTKLIGLDWMSEDVKKVAQEKVRNIVQKIGYPTKSPNVLDPQDLSDYYSGLSISNETYFANGVAFSKFGDAKEWIRLLEPTDKDRWYMTVPTVNAYYNPPGNEIVFPAGIMQYPVFQLGLPEYVSYGSFGAVAGHELSHGFDNSGRNYDVNGTYTDWWDNSTVTAFEQRANCFVQQYGNFTVPGLDNQPLHVNGDLTLGENIADAGGVSAAYGAWSLREFTQPNQLLPGLERFSKEQMFFISFGTTWCGKVRKETAVNRVYTDPHSPPQYRILGTLANSRPFKEAFNCPVKEPTCELW
ncbi:peptidase family M13 [Eremomyces bilateralis CBS 781.70]|uniref:Peptidase family M13 n=1 Tax=Eremomyces bilateralis CBS 781.70 TaxID=1392243 RepID=A0A6G1G3T2_9PEZI|nr:peptidase family M13 [Eremomyces bilateralis CBS 781.70]KAF1812755.1 peptidase family M13 [Eremomyces bilateralis CBS 781.70]